MAPLLALMLPVSCVAIEMREDEGMLHAADGEESVPHDSHGLPQDEHSEMSASEIMKMGDIVAD